MNQGGMVGGKVISKLTSFLKVLWLPRKLMEVEIPCSRVFCIACAIFSTYLLPISKSATKLRNILVDKVSQKLERYGIPDTKDNWRNLALMRYDGQLPWEEFFLAVCDIFKLVVHVHHWMEKPKVFRRYRDIDDLDIIHLQCIADVHYNPVLNRKKW